MSFPLGDWQFWAVTASAAGAAWMLVRPFLADRERPGGEACADCPSGACGAARSRPLDGRGGDVVRIGR